MTDRHDRFSSEGPKTADGVRSAFRRDRDRILYSPAFRRLAGVTQIVSPHQGQASHNRLIHSLKVAQVARGIAEELRGRPENPKHLDLDADVVEAAGLAHDLGHPPFGHAGETVLQGLFKGGTRDSFEGNAQSFRIVTCLAARHPDEGGLDLTRATLRAILKYPWMHSDSESSSNMKWGAYRIDAAAFDFAMKLGVADIKSLEADVMDWADDVTYAIHDIEDFYRAGLIPLDDLLRKDAHWERFSIWYKAEVRERDSISLDSRLGNAQQFLHTYLDRPLNGNNAERDYALARFVSQAINDCIRKLDVQRDSNGARLRIEPAIKDAVEVLKFVVRYFVISGPVLGASREGQGKMIETAFDYFYNQASMIGSHSPPSLPPLALAAAQTAFQRGHLTASRVACDAVCELTDLQLITLESVLSGRDPSFRDLYGNIW